LQNALDGDRRLHVNFARFALEGLELVFKESFQVLENALHAPAAGVDDLDDRGVLQQRVKKVLDSQIFVTPAPRLRQGEIQALLQLIVDH
jgi:hypothetical protein